MTERETLIQSIADRVEGAGEDGGAAARDPAAAREAEELLTGYLATPDGADPEVQYTAGVLYLLRATVFPQRSAPQEDVSDEMALALTLLTPFYMSPPSTPDALPPPVRSVLDRIPGCGPPPADAAELGQAHAAALNNLGMLLARMRVATGQPSQARAAAVLLREAAARFDVGSPGRAMAKCNLGYALILGDPRPEDVTEAVGALRESFERTPPDDPNYARCAYGLSAALMTASAAAEDQAVMAEVTTMLRIATESAPEGTPNLPQMLSDFGFALTQQAMSVTGERAGEATGPGLAAEAVEALTRAAGLFPECDPQRPQVLLRLAEALIAASRPGEAMDLLVASQELFNSSSRGDAAGELVFRAAMGKLRLELRADPDMQEMHAFQKKFLGLLEEGATPQYAVLRMLGMEDSSDWSKDADPVGAGVSVLDARVDNPYQMLRLIARVREEESQRFEDLPDGEREQARQEWRDYLASLREKGSSPKTMFAPLDPAATAIIDELQALCERLLPELDPSSREHALITMSTRGLKMDKAVHTPVPDHAALRQNVEEEVMPLAQAMGSDLSRLGISPDRLGPLVAFSHVSTSPFETLALVEESIRELRRKLACLCLGTPEHNDTRAVLAIRLFNISGITDDNAALTEARAIARDLVTTAWPPLPIMLSTWCSAESARLGPRTVLEDPVETAHPSQHFLARHASREAARALTWHDAASALESLEHGRAWMLSSAINTENDLDTLRDADADAYRRLLVVRDEITRESRARMLTGELPTEEERVKYSRLSREGGQLVEELSQRPGFDRFLLPVRLGMADLRPAAADGPVITVNVHPRRCDALILTRDRTRPVTVPLTGLTASDVAKQAERFRTAIAKLTADRNSPTATAAASVFGNVLGWLWDELAEPVLKELGLTQQPLPNMPWPRIWWSPTGLLNSFPLHAAGYHDKPGASVLDRAVSSYTPTVGALLRSRAHAARFGGVPSAGGTSPGNTALGTRHVLAVAMPETAGLTPLPRTAAEAEAAVSDGGRRLTGPHAIREAVLAALSGSSIAHFACHASSDPDAPAASHLLLHDGKLAVGDIAGLRLDGAELAYLSACGTSRGGARLADEALHLASAFQLAGYSQSVATLWEVGDAFAARAAAEFYRHLAPALRAPVPLPAAAALHTTIRALRDSPRAEPCVWSALVHAGA